MNNRIDLLLQNDGKKCSVEIKNVTLAVGETAYFPYSVTTRGQRHLIELMDSVKTGFCSVMLFVVKRGDCKRVSPADEIDTTYGKLLR
jgi:sugar fermentation stimulation protein A